MGVFTASGETLLDATPEETYDFISDPRNWPKLFRGSADISTSVEIPLGVGDSFTEVVEVGELSLRSTWTVITAVRGRVFAYQQVDDLGADGDGQGGVDGITTITYTLTPVDGGTMFHRVLRCELPRGVSIPVPLLVARATTANIEHFQENVGREIARVRA
ncbi:SRPBCC family protein [Actinomycetospora sp. TBRC 11914]|uniref:SRPBCC family protein n=1 Tax=Actinomycetospora sp. TBRC 11914 TaxID=2729387 RepID=UPI00145D271D|nr:SRPBCC family protein [Actinomycetospora sp. TBRC 11914]NMO88258.1 SRPBCC family protein [Actinomycetospora sp. TBRC 11914]